MFAGCVVGSVRNRAKNKVKKDAHIPKVQASVSPKKSGLAEPKLEKDQLGINEKAKQP